MHRLLGFLIFVMVMSIAGFAFAGAEILSQDFGVDSTSVPKGVFCEVNGVKLMANTPADCEKAGGNVTHVISTTVTQAGEAMDNPNEEPEIQREKDKDPEVP